ncbi:ornithine cyclodeaminase family protein [Enterococcus pallens]|uniref:Ornithine cyclodeaminase n=1 Tax=Enterococcus pallens ATCC BAA-351 TaxID=1158607 RepID=R2PXR1_9ENTE|nr:ornithine cyclodeaminase family protein [Enterococcus pallens]EOH87968.1 hypothetical protein UAU_04823 [Enterococcus pallens ATCC BAA-351]EOU18182.1 hypothetical protein I588_03171 [Enterococcus pallens ATCC BAA-351]
MTQIRVLNQAMVKEVLSLKETIQTVEDVYRGKANETSTLWPMIFYEFDPGKADMDIKSGYMKELGIYGLKLVSWYGSNPQQQLPALFGTTMLFDDQTGAPLGIVDAEYITGMRTGAAAAIGSKYLARADSETLLMVGTGHQALFQLLSHLLVIPNLKQLLIYNPLAQEQAAAFAANCKEQLLHLLDQPKIKEDQIEVREKIAQLQIRAVEDIASATGEADIVVTATPSKQPLIQADWVKPGTHFSCVGADMSGKQEIDGAIFQQARLFVDDRNQAIAVGETEQPIKQGFINETAIQGEIGEVILGRVAGRISNEDITIYDTTGIALQDLAVTKQVLDAAKKNEIGQVVDL